MLDDKGRCCGRKPMAYKSAWSTSTGPHRFCGRCDRAYHLEENEQIPNWAYRKLSDGSFERQTNKPEEGDHAVSAPNCPVYDYAMASLPPETCAYWGIPILARAFLRHEMEKAYLAGVASTEKPPKDPA